MTSPMQPLSPGDRVHVIARCQSYISNGRTGRVVALSAGGEQALVRYGDGDRIWEYVEILHPISTDA